MNSFYTQILAISPELVLIISALLMLILGIAANMKSPKILGIMTISIIIISVILGVIFYESAEVIFNNNFRRGKFELNLFLFMEVITVFCLWLSLEWLKIKKFNRFEFPIVMSLCLAFLGLVVASNNFIVLYLTMEGAAITLYILTGFKRRAVRSTEAGVKYFLLGSLFSMIFLYGVSLIYISTQSFVFNNLDLTRPLALAGFLLVIISFLFKLGIVPFHNWIIDVYEGAPTPVSAFIAMVPQVAFVGLLMKLFDNNFAGKELILLILACFSIAFGALAAIHQVNIKRFAGYISVHHLGFVLLALALNNNAAAFYYLLVYILATLGLFAGILLMRIDGNLSENIDDLAGIYKNHPLMALSFTVILLSYAGMPLFAGFFAKFYIFDIAIKYNYYMAAVIIIASIAALFVYLNIIKLIYCVDNIESFDKLKPSIFSVMIMVAFLLILLFFDNGIIYNYISNVVLK